MRNYLVLGDWNAICDQCGLKYKASQLRKRWDGLMVCEHDWETRHPQDLLRVQDEIVAPPWTRPEPEDQFVAGYSCPASGMFAVAGNGVAGCMIAGQANLWSGGS